MKGMPRTYARDPLDRFNEKWTATEAGCWEWQAYLNHHGYGNFMPSSTRRGGKVMLAHRWSYEKFVGPIPAGLQIDHLCRNRACVNPAHLEPVTPRENTMRGDTIPARNAAKTHCPQGHEYVPENIVPSEARRGGRDCLTCDRARKAAKSQRRAQARAERGLPPHPARPGAFPAYPTEQP